MAETGWNREQREEGGGGSCHALSGGVIHLFELYCVFQTISWLSFEDCLKNLGFKKILSGRTTLSFEIGFSFGNIQNLVASNSIERVESFFLIIAYEIRILDVTKR